MKTTAICPKCGKEIATLIHYYGVQEEVTLRYIKGDEYVLGDSLSFGDPESDSNLDYYKCPKCDSGICHSCERALEFLKGEQG